MDGNIVKDMLPQLNTLINKNYSLISFDSLVQESLLQILSDVLGEIDSRNKVNIEKEDLENTVKRILEMLRILNYKLDSDMSPSNFRQGIVQGDKKIIYPLLHWLITNLDELKKRAYLAQFLVKLIIPPEFMADPDIEYLYEQYENVIEEFKATHKEAENLKEKSAQIGELRADIASMESEKELVLNKISKIKKNVDDKNLLEAVKLLRLEREKRRELAQQEEKQKTILGQNEQKLFRLQIHFKELKKQSISSPFEILKKLEEECEVNGYLANEKLPVEIETRKEDIKILEEVLNQTLTKGHLDELNFKIQEVNQEINELLEKQGENTNEDKNITFRQQAAIISRKKEMKAEQLQELRQKFQVLEEEYNQKNKQLREIAGDVILRGEEFKKFVAKLRTRSSVYKKLKSQLSALKVESGILTRTIDVLLSYDPSALQEADELEDDKMSPISPKKYNTEQLKKLSKTLSEKKASVEPKINELRPLREKYRELSDVHEQKKRIYDATAAGLEHSIENLQKEVDKLQKELIEVEEEISNFEKLNAKAEEDFIKVIEEKKFYASGHKGESLRERLLHKISEQDKIGRALKEEQDRIKDSLSQAASQLRYWKDFYALMECKIANFGSEQNAGIVRRDNKTETLILNN